MEFIEEYVDATLNQKSAEERFLEKIGDMLGFNPNLVKHIGLVTYTNDTKIVQKISIDLIGSHRFRSEDLKDFKGLEIVTPNTIEINVGEIDL